MTSPNRSVSGSRVKPSPTSPTPATMSCKMRHTQRETSSLRNSSNGSALLLLPQAEQQQLSNAVVGTTATVQRCCWNRAEHNSNGPTQSWE